MLKVKVIFFKYKMQVPDCSMEHLEREGKGRGGKRKERKGKEIGSKKQMY